MLRIAGSIVAGSITALAIFWIIAMAGHLAFPLPEDLDLRDPERVARTLPSIPLAAKLIVVFAWFAAALAGGYVAKRIGGHWWSAWLIAAIVAVASVVAVMMIPYPAWMHMAAIVAPLVGGLVAGHLIPAPEGSVDDAQLQ